MSNYQEFALLGHYGPTMSRNWNQTTMPQVNELIDEYNSKINEFSTYEEADKFRDQFVNKLNCIAANPDDIDVIIKDFSDYIRRRDRKQKLEKINGVRKQKLEKINGQQS